MAGTDPNDGQFDASICNAPRRSAGMASRGTSVDGVALIASSAVLLAGIALARRRRRRAPTTD
jgi:hypothetical protein